jgi:hypothetical protein
MPSFYRPDLTADPPPSAFIPLSWVPSDEKQPKLMQFEVWGEPSTTSKVVLFSRHAKPTQLAQSGRASNCC